MEIRMESKNGPAVTGIDPVVGGDSATLASPTAGMAQSSATRFLPGSPTWNKKSTARFARNGRPRGGLDCWLRQRRALTFAEAAKKKSSSRRSENGNYAAANSGRYGCGSWVGC